MTPTEDVFEAPLNTIPTETKRISIEDIPIWYETYRKIFPSETDNYGTELIHRQLDSDDFIHHAHFLTKSEGNAIGIRWVYFNSDEKCAYVPYGGVIPEYQHKGIYPKIVQDTESFLKENGIEVIFNECENPELITDFDARTVAQDRLNFFQKLGYVFVDPHVLPYMRPGWDYSSDKYKTEVDMNHYLFGFKPLTNREKYITNEKDHPQISKEILAKLHTDMIQLDNGVRDREALVKEFSAVSAYQKAMNGAPDEFIPLITYPLRK